MSGLMEQGDTKVYEVGFHIDPNLSETDVKKTYEDVKALLGKKGSLVAEGVSRRVQLSYTISRMEEQGRQDFDSAYFAWVAYEGSGEDQPFIEEALREDKRIIRFILVKTTREAVKYAEERALMKLEEEGDEFSLEEGEVSEESETPVEESTEDDTVIGNVSR
jgi:ribosomal protein S6